MKENKLDGMGKNNSEAVRIVMEINVDGKME